MAQNIPVENLRNSSAITHICSQSDQPVRITDQNRQDLIILNEDAFYERLYLADVRKKVDEALEEVRQGKEMDAFEVLEEIREELRLEYGV